MSARRRLLLNCAGLALLVPYLSVAAEPPVLSHNPFARPSSAVSVMNSGPNEDRDGATLMPDLKATMVGGHDRLANVAGRILRPGDVSQGYTLVEVYEDRATFSREGKIVTVYVKDYPVAENAQ